jgi:hypothetical protein
MSGMSAERNQRQPISGSPTPTFQTGFPGQRVAELAGERSDLATMVGAA